MTKQRDAQTAAKTVFLGVSVRLFLEEIGILISRLGKKDPPCPVWMGFIQSLRA